MSDATPTPHTEKESTPPPLTEKDISLDWLRQIQQEDPHNLLSRCFQCGTCTAGCPVREVDERYNPRRILRMVQLGLRDEVLRSDFVWLCSSCFNCQERCPQGVSIAELMTVLKNIALAQGVRHPGFTMQAQLIAKQGRLYEVEDFDNKKRKKQKLPPIQMDTETAPRIFRLLGLEQYLPSPEEE